ncbi:Hint domain-containing protein [Halovulum sp. GXIMD14794]
MATHKVTTFEFDPKTTFSEATRSKFQLTQENWDATFGAARGSMTVEDDNDLLEDDNSTGNQGDAFGSFTGSDGQVTQNVGVELESKYTYTWTDASGAKQTTVIGQVTFEGSGLPPVAIITGPIPPVGTTLTLSDFDANPWKPGEGMAYADTVCFTRGTMILTPTGEVPIEDLHAGDLVMTRDRGAQPLRWVGSRTVAATGPLAPITIKAGALGNDRDLRVSPAHRMLVGGWKAEVLFGQREVLVTARQLTVRDDVFMVEGGEVEYFHLLLDRHEILTANGAPSESLNPSDLALDALETEQRAEIRALFPELLSGGAFAIARPMLSDADVLAMH